LVQEQDDAESRDDLIEVIALVEMAEDDKLEKQAEGERGEQREDQGQQ
jgi:hypothetical protein